MSEPQYGSPKPLYGSMKSMMSFTIHDLDPRLNQKLTDRARHEQVSKNRLVKRILARAMGLEPAGDAEDEYREFLGRWSRQDLDEFERRQAENTRVDEGDWR